MSCAWCDRLACWWFVSEHMMKACLWAASVASWRPPARSVHMLCRPGEVVGIDLGTTSSAVAVVLGGEPEIVPDEAGRTTMPSLVEAIQ